MFPTAFDEENQVLHPPSGVSPEEVSMLSVHIGTDQDGNHLVISCWKPTKEELEEINRTGRVWLLLWGLTMQPAALSGINPFTKTEENGQ